MAETKEEFYLKLKENLYGNFDSDNITEILEAVALSLDGIQLQKESRELVLYEYGTEKMIDKYTVSKAVEGLSERSLNTYRGVLRVFYQQVMKTVSEVTTDDIRIYLAYKKRDGASGNYLNLIRRTLSSFYAWCENENLVNHNPVKKIKCIRIEKKVRKALTEDEMEVLRLSAKNIRDKAIIEFLYSTGCRVSEMCSLNRSDVDFEQGKAVVLGKGKKYREVYLSSRSKILLSEYLKSREDDLDCLFEGMSMKDAPLGIHSRLKAGGVESMLRKLGKQCDIADVHPHRFRRTAATLALKRGMPIEQVQKMLGHEDIATTTIYAQSEMADVQIAHNKYVI